MMKRLLPLLLALALLLGLAGCGKTELAAFRTLETLGTKHYCAICRGGDKLSPWVNAAIDRQYQRGELQRASMQWLGSDRIAWEGDGAGLDELPEDFASRRLIVGVETDFYPLAYTENGALKGLCVDIANGIGEALGWEVQVVSISPAEVGTQLASGNIDCALGFDGSLVKAADYDVGPCFLESDVLLVVRTDSEIRRVKDLKGQRVGTVADPAVLNALRSSEKLTKYADGATQYLSLPRCIEALDKGWCAAVAADAMPLSYYQAPLQ